jgi:carbamoyl-phosphate synthase large subunit
MDKFRVLFLGGGKRVSVAEKFIAAGNSLNLDTRVMSYDLDLEQPICNIGKVLVGKKWDDPNVANDISNKISENKINLVLANVDPATLILTQLYKSIPGKIISSDYSATNICLSKKEFSKFCYSESLPIIPEADADSFPFFVKPDTGSASIGAQKINNRLELQSISNPENFIFQDFIEGMEYTVDAYVLRDGTIWGLSTRARIATSGGESVISSMLEDEEISEVCHSLISKLSLRGPITIQFIRRHSDSKLFLMEVNPRFGGGVPLSIEAGFNFPKIMLEEILGRKVSPLGKTRNLSMKRYYKEAYFEIHN